MIMEMENVYCTPETFLGIIMRWIIHTTYSFTVVLGGIALVQREFYLSFLLLWTYAEAQLIQYALSASFPETKPVCSLTDSAVFESYRSRGMPSVEALSVATITSFLLLHQLLVRRMLPFGAEKLLILILPLTVVSLYASRNATAAQLGVGIVLGTLLGTYTAAIYHFFFKYHFEELAKFLCVAWLIPGKTATMMAGGEQPDHDTVMLQPAELYPKPQTPPL